jgi:hypothetical protein
MSMVNVWTNFFIAQCSASAALLGLLFVSVSLNLNKILAFRVLANRALIAMLLLLAILIVASLMLIPGQSLAANALEVLCVAISVSAIGTITGIGGIRDTASDSHGTSLKRYARFVLQEISMLPYLIAGIMLLAERTAAFYWLAAAMILSFITSAIDAWVLLVEINR